MSAAIVQTRPAFVDPITRRFQNWCRTRKMDAIGRQQWGRLRLLIFANNLGAVALVGRTAYGFGPTVGGETARMIHGSANGPATNSATPIIGRGVQHGAPLEPVIVRYSTRIISEPAEELYLQLLAFAQQQSAYFSLTWQQQLTFDAGARTVETELRPFLHQQRRTSEWPGTELLGGVATVRWYRFTAKSRQVLQLARRLYAWRSPDRPEDLAFYLADGRCWLASIAHEREAFVDLDAAGLQALRDDVPGIRLSRDT